MNSRDGCSPVDLSPTAETAVLQAYTLFEVILVLALICAILAIGLPSIRRMLKQNQLESAAQQVRIELSKARLQSMKTGKPFVFRFQSGSGRFLVGPKTAFDKTPNGEILYKDLQNPIVFGNLHINVQSADEKEPEKQHASAIGFSGGEMLKSDESYNAPVASIMFYPNGRTSGAVFWLSDGENAVELTLRGLTGTTSIAR